MYDLIADSHHKLIRWRIVTHGGIDGYSRLIVYLQCATNNEATTVYEQFLKAIQQYHLPSRVRSDQGIENILVARHMIEKRDSQRRSMITGPSTHNQCIERLWRDMHKSATILYYKLFYFMEHMSTIYGHYTMFIFQEYPRHCIILHKAGTTTLSVQLATNLLSSCSLRVLFCYKIHS